MAAEAATEKQDFRLELAAKKFLLKTADVQGVDREKLKAEVLALVFKDELSGVYEHLCAELGWAVDGAKLSAMKAANAAKLAELDARVADAEGNLGEVEVRDAMQARADYLASTGDVAGAIAAYAATEGRTASVGHKVDLAFSIIRLHILFGDWAAVKAGLSRAQALCDSGGDWERKNKLKVYRAVFALYTRDLKSAATLLLEAVATFTATELFPYRQCIFYAVVTALVSLDRVALREKVVDSPEILAVIGQMPALAALLTSLHACKYSDFFRAFVEVADALRADMYLHPHARYYQRELRLAAYAQFLESYKAVQLGAMAAAFDVSPAFLDAELAEFIVAGRLPAKIDKVAGIVETHRPDARNAAYQGALKRGDALLNAVQRLSKVIDME